MKVLFLRCASVFPITLIVAASHLRAQDADLRDLDISRWPCAQQPEGTAKTLDGKERNRMKNRSVVDLSKETVEQLDTKAFLKKVAAYDPQLHATRRSQLNNQQKQQLESFEKQIVSLIGWLVLSYAGPPETTNCGDASFHDWHLEVFSQPLNHHPQPGDKQTPIICEISPRTEQAIYRSGVHLKSLSEFIRSGKEYKLTGNPPQLVRVTGYLLWDDEHNGKADVGQTIDYITPGNGFHHPWRSTAWEIHPVLKVEPVSSDRLVGSPPNSGPVVAQSPETVEHVTLNKPIEIVIPYGKTTLSKGMRLEVVSRSDSSVTVRYMGGNYSIPVDATDRYPPQQ